MEADGDRTDRVLKREERVQFQTLVFVSSIDMKFKLFRPCVAPLTAIGNLAVYTYFLI